MLKSIYVAATSQHVGKTTSTLGLVAALRQKGVNVGYCKPVGQKFVDLGELLVDKDALLFSKIMDFQLASEVHSPVILGQGATQAYLDNPEAFPYRERILKAAEWLHRYHEAVVYEGTGHPGVGSVVGLSNADVAKMLGASVVMVVEGGIGSTIDRLNMCTALFREQEVPIIGVIVNKVLPEKEEKVRHYVGKWLKERGIPLLGTLPYDRSLSDPIMATIKDAVGGQVLYNEDMLDNRVEEIVPGSLVEMHDLTKERNILLVVSHHRLCEAIEKIEKLTADAELEESPLAGIILTRDGRHPNSFFTTVECDEYIKKHRIPTVSTSLDTFGSVVKISRIEVKINTRTPWKAYRAIELIKKHVNLDVIMQPGLVS